MQLCPAKEECVPIKTSTRKGIVFCAFAGASALGWTWSPQTIDKKISAGAIEFSPEYSPLGISFWGRLGFPFVFNERDSGATGQAGPASVADLNQFDSKNVQRAKTGSAQRIPSVTNDFVQDGRATVMQTGKGPAGSGQGTALQSFATNRWIMLLQMWEEDTKHPSNTTHSIFQNLVPGSSPRGSVPLWNRFSCPSGARLDGCVWRV